MARPSTWAASRPASISSSTPRPSRPPTARAPTSAAAAPKASCTPAPPKASRSRSPPPPPPDAGRAGGGLFALGEQVDLEQRLLAGRDDDAALAGDTEVAILE